MLVLACVTDHLLDLGRCDIPGVDPADAHAFAMDFQHDLSRFFPRHREESLQHDDNEFHGRVVVIQEDDFEERGRLELGFLGLE